MKEGNVTRNVTRVPWQESNQRVWNSGVILARVGGNGRITTLMFELCGFQRISATIGRITYLSTPFHLKIITKRIIFGQFVAIYTLFRNHRCVGSIPAGGRVLHFRNVPGFVSKL